MNEETEKKLSVQMEFFDYIYPSISRQLDELRKQQDLNFRKISNLIQDKKQDKLVIEQYKGKIQRIEQFLIEHGLISLLGNK